MDMTQPPFRRRERDIAASLDEPFVDHARTAARAITTRNRAVTPGEMAQAFHEAYERMAEAFGYKTRAESAVPWEDVPENNKALMVATVRNVMIEQGLTICGCECHRGWNGCGCECGTL